LRLHAYRFTQEAYGAKRIANGKYSSKPINYFCTALRGFLYLETRKRQALPCVYGFKIKQPTIMKRRNFLKNSTLGTATLISAPILASQQQQDAKNTDGMNKVKEVRPIVVCTWNFHNATAKAWEVLKNGGNSLDAVEQGVMVEEADPNNQTVGLGGRPDRDGNVTLDACIMDKDSRCGSVVYLQNIVHPVSVARKVMEDTPHIILAGKGAEQFAYEKGFKKVNLLTEKSRQEWL